MSFVSYAQNFEDVLLNRVFGGQETGFYVDVGAFHPVLGSVTKALYDRGWNGINVEPGIVYDELAAQRPRDVNLRLAVMDYKGDVSFVGDAADHGMSHVDTSAGLGTNVPCDTLENIVRDYGKGRPVDFIKVDAEGAEGAIVRSTNWRSLRPRLLIFEATLPWSTTLANGDWEPLLLEQGYVRVYFDGINCFYVPEEELREVKRFFEVPVNVLDRVVRIDQVPFDEYERLLSRYEALEAHHSAALNDMIEQRDTIFAELCAMQLAKADVTPDRDTLRDECNHFTPTAPHRRSLARRAIRLVYFFIRPVARPVAWRLRGFMTAEMLAELGEIRRHQDALNREVVALCGSVSPELHQHLLRLRDEIVTSLNQQLRHERHEIISGVRRKASP